MQAGNLVGGDVLAYTSRVLVGGVQREHVSWTVDRELSGDMPDQVVAGSGITQATGSVQFAGDEVQTLARNPFNRATGWLPRIGDRVQIFGGDNVTEWVQFTGRIDKVSGTLDSGFQATLIDDYDRLSAAVSHVPLLRNMPPLTDGEPRRGIGLTSTYYTDLALRRGGFYATPPTEPNRALSVTGQGSMWPADQGSSGTLVSGGGNAVGTTHAGFRAAPWGYSASDFNLTYAPRTSESPSKAVQLTVMVAPDHAGEFFLTVYYGSSNNVQLAITTGRVAILRVNGAEACRVSLDSGTIVTALLKAGTVTLKTDTGTTRTGTGAIGGTAMSSILTSGTYSTRVAGIQVSHPNDTSQEFRSLAWAPSAVLDMSNNQVNGLMDAGRAIDQVRADDLLKEISEATLAAMWIDERGVFQWVPTLALRARPAVRTMTTLNDVLSLDWEESLLGSRSSVTVNGRIPAISTSTYRSKELYRGSRESLKSGEVSEEFVGPDTDYDWIMPDETMTVLNPTPWGAYNAGLKTFGGANYTSSGETINAAGLSMTITFDKLGVTQYKITHKAGVYPADVTADLATSPIASNLWPRNQDNPLPVIKGYGEVQWADVSLTPISAGGVGPELVHEASYWNNRSDSNEIIGRIATYLADQTAIPKPVITGLEIVYDPRLQLGDVINIKSERLMGVTMKALIVGVSNSGGGKHSQSLSVRLISTTSTFTTYAEFNDALVSANLTYTQWDALGPKPHTYTQFNTAE